MRAKDIKYEVVKRLQELAYAIDDKKYEHDLDYLRYNLRKIEIMYEDYLGMKSNREYKIKTEFNKSYK